jgi:aminopeptidase N
MDDGSILGARTGFGREWALDLVSHELAHSWFGNLVTTKDWSNLWLNEGFATFMEAVYREKLNGRTDYMRKVREDADAFMDSDSFSQIRPPLLNLKAHPDTVFDAPTFVYQKGGAVLHTLREELGDEVFWKAVNVYLNRHKFNVVDYTDLKKVMEEVSGKDLTWFFNQWVIKGGYPKLTVKPTYSATKKRLILTVTQTQKIDAITPAVFTLPLEVEIRTAKGTKTEKIKVDKRVQTISLPVDGKPSKITIDKMEKIPIKAVKVLAMPK